MFSYILLDIYMFSALLMSYPLTGYPSVKIDKSVLQECPTRVSHKSVLQECPTRVSHKSVLQECPTRVSHKSVL